MSSSSSNSSRPCRRGTNEHAPLQLMFAVTTAPADKLPSTFDQGILLQMKVSRARRQQHGHLLIAAGPRARMLSLLWRESILRDSPAPNYTLLQLEYVWSSIRPESSFFQPRMPLPQQPKKQYSLPSHALAQLECFQCTLSDPSH